jgi:hypothetical protein
MSKPLKPNVRARYGHEGVNYCVEFRNVHSDLLGLTIQAHRLLKEEHGIEADINKIGMHVS